MLGSRRDGGDVCGQADDVYGNVAVAVRPVAELTEVAVSPRNGGIRVSDRKKLEQLPPRKHHANDGAERPLLFHTHFHESPPT